MSRVWDENWFGSTKTLDVHIGWLRRKLGDPRPYIDTVRGVGFRFAAPDEEARRPPNPAAAGARPTCSCWRSSRSRCRSRRASADRVDAEVRSQARAQADVVAATVADLLGRATARGAERVVEVAAAQRARPRDRRQPPRALLADSEGAPRRRATTAPGRRSRAALAGRRDQRQRSSQTLGQALLATAVPILGNGRPGRRGTDHPERRGGRSRGRGGHGSGWR